MIALLLIFVFAYAVVEFILIKLKIENMFISFLVCLILGISIVCVPLFNQLEIGNSEYILEVNERRILRNNQTGEYFYFSEANPFNPIHFVEITIIDAEDVAPLIEIEKQYEDIVAEVQKERDEAFSKIDIFN